MNNELSREEQKKKEFYENIVFNEYKDCKTRVAIMKRKYDGLPINFSDVYSRVVNYQIKKYGSQLGSVGDFQYQDRNKQAKLACQRKYRRRNYESKIKDNMEMVK